VTHQVADQAGVLADLLGPAAIGHPRRLDHRSVVAHIVDHTDEAVVEHRERLVQDVLQRRHGRPSRWNGIAALLIDFVALLWRERHGVPGFKSPAAL